MNLILALIRRDLTLSMRQGGGVGTALGFFLTVVVLLPIGIGPDQALLARIAPGALWISLLLSVLLSADRIYQQDYEDGSLDVMTMGPVPFELVALAKSVARSRAATSAQRTALEAVSWITPPPLPVERNMSGRSSISASQSRTCVSSSVHAGLVCQSIPCTPNPDEMRSPSIAGPEALAGK